MTAPAIRRETAPGVLGTKRPNLVTQKDSAWDKVQFRVQCEVWLNPDVAKQVEDAIMPGPGRTEQALTDAEKLVVGNIEVGANDIFYEIISLGFKDLRNP
jgi:hypothetical protein